MATILLVDERDSNRGVLAALLRQKGHRVLETADSAEAVEMLRAERPDLAIVNVLMAVMNGFPFVLRPGARMEFPETRLILSAPRYLLPETRRLAEACGVSHVISKPVQPQEAVQAVSVTLAQAPAPSAGSEGAHQASIESYLGSIAESLRRHVVELEEATRRLEQRVAEGTAQLDTARAALEQEVAKRLLAEDELTQANRRLHEQAMRDPLTGLYNRRHLLDSFERELHRARRSGERLGVMMIDIDHFKRCNDTYGHAAGDAVLRSVARYMLSLIRGEDILCRYGGEEFVLVQAKASPEAVLQRAEKFREGVQEQTVRHEEMQLGPVTLSIGISMFPDHATSVEALLHSADLALYDAKDGGRNQVVMGAAAEPKTIPGGRRARISGLG